LASSHSKNEKSPKAIFYHRRNPQPVRGGQCFKQAGIGQNFHGLQKGANEVFAMGGVNAGLAANGGINLGQKRGWNLNEVDAAPEDGCGEACEITNHTATEGYDFVTPFNAGRQ
jgi:hypothetical protein